LCDWWLNKTYGLPCQPVSTDLGHPTFPNRFLALLPAEEASQAAQKSEEAIREEWKRLAQQVYNALTSTSILPADEQTADIWRNQIQGLLEIYWVVLPWPGDDQPPGTAQAEAGKELYERLCQPPQGKDWEFRQIYEALTQKGQYDPNWGTGGAFSMTLQTARSTPGKTCGTLNRRRKPATSAPSAVSGRPCVRKLWMAGISGLKLPGTYRRRTTTTSNPTAKSASAPSAR
jgi:hypothetical protein